LNSLTVAPGSGSSSPDLFTFVTLPLTVIARTGAAEIPQANAQKNTAIHNFFVKFRFICSPPFSSSGIPTRVLPSSAFHNTSLPAPQGRR
jgi:hypothetical protein